MVMQEANKCEQEFGQISCSDPTFEDPSYVQNMLEKIEQFPVRCR